MGAGLLAEGIAMGECSSCVSIESGKRGNPALTSESYTTLALLFFAGRKLGICECSIM